MRQLTPEAEPVTEVNIIPVIDISLVLLVILFVTAPLLSYPTLQVALPSSKRPLDSSDSIAVTYGQDGTVWVRAGQSSWPQLQADIEREVKHAPGSMVLLRVDKSVPYRIVQRLIGVAKAANAPAIALATEPPRTK